MHVLHGWGTRCFVSSLTHVGGVLANFHGPDGLPIIKHLLAMLQDVVTVTSWTSLAQAVQTYSGESLRVKVLQPPDPGRPLPVMKPLEIASLRFNLTIEPGAGLSGAAQGIQAAVSFTCTSALQKHAFLVRCVEGLHRSRHC